MDIKRVLTRLKIQILKFDVITYLLTLAYKRKWVTSWTSTCFKNKPV